MATPTELFISEYIEGSSFNKAIELFNGTGADVDLSTYTLELYSNGSSTVSQSVTLGGTLLDGEVFVLAHGSADAAILGAADLVATAVINFNGDDAVVLRNNGAVIDAFGQVGVDPGSEWDGGGQNDTLIRMSSIMDGDTDETNAFDTAVEWNVLATDDFSDLGMHSIDASGGVFISEYVEGSSNNKAIEIFNNSGAVVDLSTYTLEFFFNGSTSAGTTIALSGMLAAGDVFVVADDGADAAILAEADLTPTNGFFNGDDAIVLADGGTVLDVIGQVGTDPGSEWGTGDASTQNNTIRRKASVSEGDADGSDAFDPAAEWDGFAQDTFDGLGSHSTGGDPVPGVSVDAGDGVSLAESGGTDSITIALDTLPTTDVDITITVDGQLEMSDDGVNFFSGACAFSFSDQTPRTFFFRAVDDAVVEGPHSGTISFETASTDPDYDMLAIADVIADITDNDAGITAIYDVQGSGAASALVGNTVTISGIVTGDFQDGNGEDGDLNGFYVQEEVGDGDAATSDGIFIFTGSSPAFDLTKGDRVEITGDVTEFFGETQISADSVVITEAGAVADVTTLAAEVSLPATDAILNSDGEYIADLEHVEGMLVEIVTPTVVTEMFNLDRFGEFRVSEGGRPEQFTQSNAPDAAGFDAHLQDVAKRSITIDDGSTFQNPDPIIWPDGELDTADAFRMGSEVTDLIGNIRFSRGSGGSGDEVYRLNTIEDPTIDTTTNPRPALEDVGGDITVASFNVLNYFTTLNNERSFDNIPLTDAGLEPRGANDFNFDGEGLEPGDPGYVADTREFDRQTEKLVTQLVALDADVLGLVEIENSIADEALANIVAEVNAVLGAGTYDYVATPGLVGTDAITTAFMYKPTAVTLSGSAEILDDVSFTDPNATGQGKNRAALAQTFVDDLSGESFTAVVNHFKSKGSSGLSAGDPLNPDSDQGDGAGFWNDTRTKASIALDAWLMDDVDGLGLTDEDNILILGDLNAYAEETPITTLEGLGYIDVAAEFIDDPYSFVFDGQIGTLDYAMANGALFDNITGATEWHINADEPDAYDYNLDFGRPAGIFDGTEAARASDHDPVVLGLSFAPNVAVYTDDSQTTFVGGFAGLQDAIDGAPAGGFIVVEDADASGVSGAFTVATDGLLVRTKNGVDATFQLDDGLTAFSLRGKGDADIFGGDGDEVLRGGNDGNVIAGGLGGDILSGRRGEDTLIGGEGNDRLRGGEEADEFVYEAGDARDVIRDFTIGEDVIALNANVGYASFAEMEAGGAIIEKESGAILRFDNGDRLVLNDVDAASLSANDFLFFAEIS